MKPGGVMEPGAVMEPGGVMEPGDGSPSWPAERSHLNVVKPRVTPVLLRLRLGRLLPATLPQLSVLRP